MKTHPGFTLKLRQPNVRGLVLACGIIFAVAGCATAEPTVAVVAEPGVQFSLPLGKTASINGNGTKITFKQVKADSRCPTDVMCVWEGDAQIEVTVSRPGSPDDTRILSLHTPNEMTSGDLRIRFVGLTPVPRQADGNAPRAYVAQLLANRI
jgi:hypothetical protein